MNVDAAFPEGMVAEIEKFLADDAKRPAGQDLYDDVFLTGLMFPLQRQKELAWMMRRARERSPVTVMEIGADKAGGLYHWVKCLPSVKNVIACEIRGTPYRFAFERAFPDKNFFWMPHCSRTPDVRQEIVAAFGGIDCLFIDGCKAHFEQDFDHYLPLLNADATVFMHDIQDRAPTIAYQSVSRREGVVATSYINTEDSYDALVREHNGVPPSGAHETWLRYWKGRSCGVGMLRSEGFGK